MTVISETEALAFDRLARRVGLAGFTGDLLAVLAAMEQHLGDGHGGETTRRVHLLQQEIDGLRETMDGLERAVTGSGKAYRAARQTIDLLAKDLDDARADYAAAVARARRFDAKSPA